MNSNQIKPVRRNRHHSAPADAKKVPNTNPDLPTIEECREVVLELDFPGEITESTIERVVGTFLEGRDLLPDLRALKKYIRYVFGKRIGRIRHTVRHSFIWMEVDFSPHAEPTGNRWRDCAVIELPYQPVTMFKRNREWQRTLR